MLKEKVKFPYSPPPNTFQKIKKSKDWITLAAWKMLRKDYVHVILHEQRFEACHMCESFDNSVNVNAWALINVKSSIPLINC